MAATLSNQLQARFTLIETLPDNWDGDNSDPPNRVLLQFAKRLIQALIDRGIPEPFIL